MPHLYNSSFKFTTITPFTSQDQGKALHIINHILNNPESIDFRQPVAWEAMQLLDYPEIIKHPMDLGTVKNKLTNKEYVHIQQFLDDTELIWDNCKSYNIKGTWIYGLADKLQKNSKKMLKNYFPKIPMVSIKKDAIANQIKSTGNISQSSKPEGLAKSSKAKPPAKKQETKKKDTALFYQEDDQQITLDQKNKLADKFKELSDSKNLLIVEYIQEICPTAFRELDQTAQIIVDNMDVYTFRQLLEKIQEIEQFHSAPSKKAKQD